VRVAKKQETGADPNDPETARAKLEEEAKAAAKDQREQAHLETMQALVHHLSRPKKIIRGPDGRAQGVQ
jgi:hypothetical protein